MSLLIILVALQPSLPIEAEAPTEPGVQELEEQSPRLPSLLTSSASLGGSKTILLFDNSPEELTEHTVSCYTHGDGLLQGRDTD